jgi:hypothetical protein
MAIRTEIDESGSERMMVPDSKRGVLVAEGMVERLTGAGKFVVAPVKEAVDVRVGDRVMIMILDPLQPDVYLETSKERVTWPFPSNWAIIVKGNKFVERCTVFYDGKQLSALNPAGVSKYDLPLPRDAVLNFRIPETANPDNEAIVEVKDGDRSILQEKFGSLPVMSLKEAYPTVTVSGRFSPLNKTDIYASSVEFTNTATGQVFLAVDTNGEYSIQLPNRESYRVSVSWNMVPGNKAGNAEAGTLTLNAEDNAYKFDANW